MSTQHPSENRGTYALVMHLPHATTIRIGALGAHEFPRGYYLYLGSALGGLAQRIARHLRPEKKLHWHIDYFLQHAQVKQAWTHQGAERFECVWARAALALPHARVVAPRFGASDCACPAHLVFVGARMPKFP